MVFVYYENSLARSADGGATWQDLAPQDSGVQLFFDTTNPGAIYWFSAHLGALKSTDDGLTFATIPPPPVSTIYADPGKPGRLLGDGSGTNAGTILESDDDGATWSSRASGIVIAADFADKVIFARQNSTIVKISADLSTAAAVGSSIANVTGASASGGTLYVPLHGGHNVFAVKLDPSGNVLYSTYFGGSNDDTATAITVDRSGSVYVTGYTSSLDFPTTPGAYSKPSMAGTFLFKLNPNGSQAYSTWFTYSAGPSASASAIAVDNAGSAYLAGPSYGSLPTTPGAYRSACQCGVTSGGFGGPALVNYDAFATKFDPTGSTLVYSTYLGLSWPALGPYAVALAPDGTAYITGSGGTVRLNATGTAILGSRPPADQNNGSGFGTLTAQAIALGADGSVFLAGTPVFDGFVTTPGSFQPNRPAYPSLPNQGSPVLNAIEKWDAALQTRLAATYFGGAYTTQIRCISVDPSGNLYFGGYTDPHSLPGRTEIQEGFTETQGGIFGLTGFLSELSPDLSALLFSTYLGDNEVFGVQSLALNADGDVIIAGATGFVNDPTFAPMYVWINAITPATPPAVRIDSILNAASLLGGAITPNETIVIEGAGFSTSAQLSFGAEAVTPISISPTQILATVPADLAAGIVLISVQSQGSQSNQVLTEIAAAAPGLYSVDGTGTGQGYILNQDGSVNSSSNPASQGDKITVYATGAGPMSFAGPYAVTASPVSVFISGFYCNGVAATVDQNATLPGNIFELTVIVPNLPASLGGPAQPLSGQLGIMLQAAGQSSQRGLSIAIK